MSSNWKSVFHYDKDGKTLTGSKDALIKGVLAGRAVRIAVHSAADTEWRHVFEPSAVFAGRGQVSAQHVFMGSEQEDADPNILKVIQPLITIVQNYNTSGRVFSVSRRGEVETKDIYNWPVEWFLSE
jgi:hypothetical protein